MTLKYKMPVKARKVSNARPKSLILTIPAAARDILKIEPNEQLMLEVYQNENETYIKIYKD